MAFTYGAGVSDATRLTTAERTATVWTDGHLVYDTELDALYVGDGTTAGGVAVGGGGGGTPAGSDTEVQFNDGGAFGADAALVFDKSVGKLQSTYFQVGTAYQLKTLSNNNEVAIGAGAGDSATGTNGMTAIGLDAGNNSDNLSYSLLFGSAAGLNATYSNLDDFNSTFIGASAGAFSVNCNASTFIGGSAGTSATYDFVGPSLFASVFIGGGAGTSSTNAYECIVIGNSAHQSTTGARNTCIGNNAFGTSSVSTSIGIGQYSFEFASGADNVGLGDYTFNFSSATESTGVGANAFSGASNVVQSLAFGRFAGQGAVDPYVCTFIGSSSGYGSNALTDCVGVGSNTLQGAVSALQATAIGNAASLGAINASFSVAIGAFAGGTFDVFQSDILRSILIGAYAGADSPAINDCIFIGYHAGIQDTVDNITVPGWNIAIGRYSGTGGFSNSIAIGNAAINDAASQLNLANIIYASGIKVDDTPSASPSGGSVGVNTKDFADGVGVFALEEVVTAPTVGATTAGILFVQGGSLKYIGTSGTITTLAPA